MPIAHESVCCAEIGQVWQKVEDERRDIQMKCITEYPGSQSTCLDVWVHETHLLITHSDSSTAQVITPEASMFIFILTMTSALTGFILVVP